ncbi:hypothetical protein E2C01_030957 [Portunus trituberculatus]|uniref:Uncharacterized protein n=1 Tax=Portunus trituberculatus TaxID=210409 RepID=A0A5B7EWB3_PORTR|nr:hypothetical protein [Portunus trituberculatus]
MVDVVVVVVVVEEEEVVEVDHRDLASPLPSLSRDLFPTCRHLTREWRGWKKKKKKKKKNER